MMLQHQKVIWIRFDVKYDKDINLSEKLSRLKKIYHYYFYTSSIELLQDANAFQMSLTHYVDILHS
jgi:hypothetical protein